MKLSHFAIFLALIVLHAGCRTTDRAPRQFFVVENFTGLESLDSGRAFLLQYELTDRAGRPLVVTNCQELAKLPETVIAPSAYPHYRVLQMNCAALDLYAGSKPAERSYLPEHLSKSFIRALPADSVPLVSVEDATQRQGQRLGQHEAELRFLKVEPNEIQVETRTDRLVYHRMACADFNGDNLEDWLIRVDSAGLDSSGKGTDLFTVSRERAEGPITILWRSQR